MISRQLSAFLALSQTMKCKYFVSMDSSCCSTNKLICNADVGQDNLIEVIVSPQLELSLWGLITIL